MTVSICCITYNHASYIRQCLDGFIMQECDFDIEILIHDDASTDGTQAIIKEYQEKYPDIIKPIFQTENQYSNGVRGINIIYNFPRAKGKYIALCEGDDFWTDSLKLQKQVDFLDNNNEFNICGHWQTTVNKDSEEIISAMDARSRLSTLTTRCVLFYTRDLKSDFYDNLKTYKNLGETYIYHYLSQFAKSEILPFHGAAYRISPSGVYSMIGQENQIKISLRGSTDMQQIFSKSTNYPVFEKITIRKCHFLNDYSLLLLSKGKVHEAMTKNILYNKEVLKLKKKARYSSIFFKMNLYFYYRIVANYFKRREGILKIH